MSKARLLFNITFVRGGKNKPQTLNFIGTLKFITLVHVQESTTNKWVRNSSLAVGEIAI